ncbi:MAG: hypothetical protein ACYTGK_11695 [Planctomycetota bacterium]|jgi:hypothetical protein
MRYLMAVLILSACATGPRGLVNRAVKASGGSDALAAVHSYHIEKDGTWQSEPYRALNHLRERTDYRRQLKASQWELSAWVLGPDEETYTTMGGKTVLQAGPHRDETVLHMKVETSVYLPDRLLADDVTLDRTDPVMIGKTECPAAEVRFGCSKPLTYVFDPYTRRLRQIRFTMLTPDGQREVPAVMDLATHEEFLGVWVPRTTFLSWGEGEERSTIREEVTKILWNPSIPAATLAAPQVDEPLEIGVKEIPTATVAQHTYEGPYDKIDTAIEKVRAWIEANGGEISGSTAVVYPEMTIQRAVIQIPARVDNAPTGGDVKLLKRRGFRFAYAGYEGTWEGPVMLISNVTAWCREQGYQPSGHARVEYVTVDPATKECVAEVGFPVRQRSR